MHLMLALAAIAIIFPGDTPYRPPVGTVIWSNGPGHAATLLPIDFVEFSLSPSRARPHQSVIECESSWNANAHNKQTGMLGRWQVWIGHAPEMASMGLDISSEAHRAWFAGWVLWPRQGRSAWEC